MQTEIKKTLRGHEIELKAAFGLEPDGGEQAWPAVTRSELLAAGVSPKKVDQVFAQLRLWVARNPEHNHKKQLLTLAQGLDRVLPRPPRGRR